MPIWIKLPPFQFDVDIIRGEDLENEENPVALSTKYYQMLEPVKWKRGGVYFLYSKDGDLLYVGRSVNVKQRLIDHLMGGSGNTKQFSDEISNVKGFYVYDIADQEIYETYAIKTLRPKYNRAKTDKVRGNYKQSM